MYETDHSPEDPSSINHGYTYTEKVGPNASGTTVLRHLSTGYAHSSESAWRARINAGEVLLDGARAEVDTPVSPGCRLSWVRPPWREPEVPTSYSILHRDSHVLAVEKPAGLPTMPAGGVFLENTLLSLVRKRFPQATPVHRLGRWTSGVLLFALSPLARRSLTRSLRERTCLKRYRALAQGVAASMYWRSTQPIGPVPHDILGTVHAASAGGRPAESEITVVRQLQHTFLADVEIRTGKPHQVRIHLAASGHPLVGDPLYPEGGVPSASSEALPGDPGYQLHAAMIRLEHPLGGTLVVMSHLPEGLQAG